MHGREFCMRWITSGWLGSVIGPEHSKAIHGSAGGLDPQLAPNRCVWMSTVARTSLSVQVFGAEDSAVLWH